MSTWHRHRAQRNSRASSIAPPGGEGWTIRDHRAILHSEPYASADLGAASDVTSKSVQSEAASASSPTPISHQLTSDVIAGTRGARLLWQAASAQGGNNDTSQAGAVGRFSAGSLRPAQSVHEGCSPNNRAFPQPPTRPPLCPRRNEGIPGAWAILFVRAVLNDPAGCDRPSPVLGAVAVAFRLSNTLGTLESRFLSWLHGSRPTRSRTYASPNPLPCPAQGSLPAGRAHPWPGGFRTRWMTNKVS